MKYTGYSYRVSRRISPDCLEEAKLTVTLDESDDIENAIEEVQERVYGSLISTKKILGSSPADEVNYEH